MKKILLFITACTVTSILSAQYIYKIKADSVLITNDSCTAELNLENSTKNVKGFLYNKGNGRTEFRRGAIKLNDSLYLIGSDTINVKGGNGNLRFGIEDNTTDQDRIFNPGFYDFMLRTTADYGDLSTNYFKYNPYIGELEIIARNGFGSNAELIFDPYSFYVNTQAAYNPAVSATMQVNQDVAYMAVYSPAGSGFVEQYYSPSLGGFFHNTLGARFQNKPYGITINSTDTSIKIGVGTSQNDWDLKGIRIKTTKDLVFDNYPNSRNDGTTTKGFYTDANGNLKYGTISINVQNGLIFNSGTGKYELGGTGNTDGRLNRDTYINTYDGTTDRKLFINTEQIVNNGGLFFQIDRTNGAIFRAQGGGFNQQTPKVVRIGNYDVNGNDATESNNTYLLTTQEILNNGWGSNGTFKGIVVRLNGSNADNNYNLTGLEINSRHHYTSTFNANGNAGNTALKLTANSVGAQGWLKALTYALYIDSGRVYSRDSVMFGTTTPGAFFHVNGTSRFDLGGDATGDIFYRNSSGLFTRLGIGTNGQVLTVNGSGLPSWATGSGGGSGLLTADNGLTANTSTNVRLGGSLLSNTTIDAGTSYLLNVTGNNTTSNGVLKLNNSGAGWAMLANSGASGIQTSFSNGIGLYSVGTTGIGLYSNLSGGEGLILLDENSGTNNTWIMGELSRQSTGTVANGFGESLIWKLEAANGSVYRTTDLVSKWSDATNKVSQFIITGTSNAAVGSPADLLTITGTGATKLNKYGTGTFTGTPAYALQVDASGNIIEGSVSGGSGYTTVQENGSGLTQRSTLNFNYGVTAADNSGASKTDINVDLSNSESFRTSDTTLTSANTYGDATYLSLAAGTWLITGNVTIESTNNNAQRITYKLWDGTTVYQAGESSSNAMGANTKGYVSIPISSLVVLGSTTTIKISIASTLNSSVIKATPADNNSGTTNKATSIRAVRIK